MPRSIVPRDVMVLGGGVAAIEVTLALLDLSDGAARITVIAPHDRVILEALAPASAFGLISGASSTSLSELASMRGFTWVQDRALEFNPDRAAVRCAATGEHEYDSLIVAVGAARVAAFPEPVITYFGSASHADVVELRDEIENGVVSSVAVVVPSGVSWALPAYEIALLLARAARSTHVELACTVITPEPEPFALFGPRVTASVAGLLDEAAVVVRTSVQPKVAPGKIDLGPGEGTLFADRIVALPRAEAIRIEGLPRDSDGFVPVDGYGRVRGHADVYAAGDCTAFPVKQGGLATLQADVVAKHIAVDMGADVASETFQPVMRGKLITGDAEWYLRYPVAGGAGEGDVHEAPLWMPPLKVWGRYLPRRLEPS